MPHIAPSTKLPFLLLALYLSACTPDTGTEPAGQTTDSTPPAAADSLYFGGPIITVNDTQPNAEAVAVRDGRIIAVGDLAELNDFMGDQTQRIDLTGHTLAPGFIDGHAHVSAFGLQAVAANLLAPPDGKVETIGQLVQTLKAWAESSEDDERIGWIFGLGYDDSVLQEGRHPTREDLDLVSTTMPVMVVHISGHFAAVNSLGLEKAGYSADTPDPEGGIIRRQPGSTEPNGVLEELAAIPLVMGSLFPKSPEDFAYFMSKGVEMAMSFGYTTAHEGRAFAPTHAGLAAYAETKGFPIDIVSYIDYSNTAPLESDWYGMEYRGGYRVAGMKITLDGSPQGRTAWRTEPYLLPPDGQDADYLGYPAIPDDTIVSGLIDQAYRKGWQVLVHANGDAAVDQFLKAERLAFDQYGPGDRRHTLIHGQYVRLDQLDEMAELQIAASLFPMHTFYWGDWHAQLIGEEKAQRISPTRSALDRGIALTSHSDAPVALPNLMQVMWATVNRQSRSGRTMGAEERLSPAEALRSITLAGAWQHFEEADKGSIEVGKRADLVILSDNPLTIQPELINQITVLETIKDGATVWARN